MRLGYEAAGVVRAVGAGAEGPGGPVHPGDEVIAYPVQGAYATELVVPGGRACWPNRPGFPSPKASGLLLSGVTAAPCPSGHRRGPGRHGRGPRGHRWRGPDGGPAGLNAGARVIGTANEKNHDLLRQLGAEPVTYGDGLLERIGALAPDGVDAAIDCVGTDEAITTSLALVADRGRIATIAAFQRGTDEGIKVLGAGPGGDPGTEVRAAARAGLVRLAEKGMLKVIMAATYPLAEVAAAHRALAGGHNRGKIALVP